MVGGGGRMELAMYTCIYRLKICLVVGILVEGCVREKSVLLASSCLDLNGVCFLVAAPATFWDLVKILIRDSQLFLGSLLTTFDILCRCTHL